MAMMRLTRSSEIATATWRKRLASKDISPGPRRCHDRGRPVPLEYPGVGHRGAARLELEALAGSASDARDCIAWGSPSGREPAGYPGQIAAPTHGKNRLELCKFKSRSFVSMNAEGFARKVHHCLPSKPSRTSRTSRTVEACTYRSHASRRSSAV